MPRPRLAWLVGSRFITARTVGLTVGDRIISHLQFADVTLPTAYAAPPHRRWLVTYYMHGTNHDQSTRATTPR